MKWYLDFGHGGKDPGALGQSCKKDAKYGYTIKAANYTT